MAGKLNEKKFKEFVSLQRGFDLPSDTRIEGSYPVVASTSINGYHSEYKVEPPCVVTGRSGSLGTVQYIDSPCWPLNTTLWVKDFKGNHPRYVYYYLQTMNLAKYNAGAGVPTLNKNHLDEVEVQIHDFEIQGRIADILSAYDELIENNNQRIRVLEQVAQDLYQEWFVHFRFPNHENVPMVESELGLIPQGYQIVKLEDITTKIGSGATPRGGKEAYKDAGITLIRSLNVYDFELILEGLVFIDDRQAQELDNVQVEAQDILLNITGASVARCCMVPSFLLPARVNQHVAIIRSNPDIANSFYVLHTINSHSYKQNLLALAQAGATREALTKSTIENFKIILPPVELQNAFSDICQSNQMQENLLQRNHLLREARDMLLSRLVSGELDVSEIEDNEDV